MATAGNERYLRYLLLTGEGGSLILRSILDRETAKSTRPLDELLKEKRVPLTKGCKPDDPQYMKLFPSVGNRDIGTWDISLLAKVILQLFKTNLTKDEISDISLLRDLRNVLSHAASFSKDEDEYDVDRQRMTSLLIRLSNGLDRPVHDKCQNLIKSCDSGPIDISGAIERVKEISRYDEIFAEHLNTLTENVADISKKVDTVLVEVEDLKTLLQELVQENARAHSFYVLGSKMILKGPDARLTDLGEKAIERVFRTGLRRAGGDRDISKMTTEVMCILDDIENCNNVEINEIERLCVKMSMKCRTFRGLLELLEYLQGDVFKKRLLGLVQAVEEMYGGVFRITFEIERDSLYEIQYSLENRKSDLFRPETLGEDDQRPTDSHNRSVDETESTGSGSQLLDLDLAEENAALLDEIIELLEMSDRENAEVIMLTGKTGAGKSAMINTIHKVLTGKYYNLARQGSGKAQSGTLHLGRDNK